MGWGNFNPMMAMQQGMMNGGGAGGMGMGGMDPSAMMGVSIDSLPQNRCLPS